MEELILSLINLIGTKPGLTGKIYSQMLSTEMKEVTAAIILDNGKVLIARRAPGEKMAGGWEFPGGKIETGETPEYCLERELFEEFGVKTKISDFVAESIFEYPLGAIRLLAYMAEIVEGDISLSVHDEIAWCAIGDLSSYNLLPADMPIAQRLKEIFI